jgi:hypothetical protein
MRQPPLTLKLAHVLQGPFVLLQDDGLFGMVIERLVGLIQSCEIDRGCCIVQSFATDHVRAFSVHLYRSINA